MSDFFVKICGMTNYSDALHVCRCGASAIGFIAWPKSKRYVESTKIGKIIVELNKKYEKVSKVGVFVNESFDTIVEYIREGINVVQLHGDESYEYVAELKLYLQNNVPGIYRDLEIWKAMGVKSFTDIDILNKHDVDKVLIDTYRADMYGGTGEIADWKLAEIAVEKISKPVILAGGLNSENVVNAIETVKPFGVDLSSGVESAPGFKKHKLISELFKNINGFLLVTDRNYILGYSVSFMNRN
jgi:phosphoribosylanthranilate isomerase